jgi:hypothetical protein
MLLGMTVDHRALIDRLTGALSRSDYPALSESFAPDAVMEFPQSGEVFEGIDNIRGQFADYPKMPEAHLSAVEVGAEPPTYALSPSYTLISVGGSGTTGTATFRARYPDQSLWWVVILYDTDGDRLSHAKFYFAPEFEPAEWRAKYRGRSSGRDTDG